MVPSPSQSLIVSLINNKQRSTREYRCHLSDVLSSFWICPEIVCEHGIGIAGRLKHCQSVFDSTLEMNLQRHVISCSISHIKDPLSELVVGESYLIPIESNSRCSIESLEDKVRLSNEIIIVPSLMRLSYLLIIFP